MFTGLIRELGTLISSTKNATGAELVVEVDSLAPLIALGDSVAINGACLTATKINGGKITFDAVSETLSKTTIGKLSINDKLNLEPALAVGERLGGHFVAGHIDGIGKLKLREQKGESLELTFEAAGEIIADIVPKGSIAIDGVSLTVAKLEDNSFKIAVIPHTLANTTLAELSIGAEVNLETDMLIKAVRRIMSGAGADNSQTGGSGLSLDFLREHGFA